MAHYELVFPVLVQHIKLNDKPHFRLRPLFVPYPQVTHQRYQSAISQLKKEVQHSFKYFKLDRQLAPQLQWFMLRPEITPERMSLQFKLGKHLIDGPFSVFRFSLQGLNVSFLPDIDNTLLIEQGDSAAERREQISKAVRAYLRQERDDMEDEFDPTHYYARPKDFLTDITVKIRIKHRENKFEAEKEDNLFAHLFMPQEFDGAHEIQRVAYDLTEKYPAELNRAYFREEAVEQLRQLIFSGVNTPLAIVGKEGVGRHTLLHEMAYRYVEERTAAERAYGSMWLLDPTRVIAGMSIVGMWQKRFEAIIRYLLKPVGKKDTAHILIVDNPIALLRIGTSASNRLTLSDVLKPYLEQRRLQLILIANPQEWSVFQEKDRSLAELFQVHRVNEPAIQQATHMILEQRKHLEDRHQVTISISAIQQLLDIQRNYLSRQALPGAITQYLEQLAVKYREGQIDAYQVRNDFQASSGLQAHIFDNSYTFQTEEVRREIRAYLIGQDAAVEALAQVVHLYKAKLNNPERPVSSLLFIGPTGVGKTQAAKVLSDYLLGGEKHLLRFDMNEYVDPGAAQRLIGDYYNPDGQLTGKVRYQPFSIILFDEIEKAHPSIRDLLLQVLDDGRLTDSMGRTVDFTNSIIIMTSNLGAEAIGRDLQLGKTDASEADIYEREMKKYFRPEFINRIDKTVVFRKLGRRDIQGIARLQIRALLKRDGFIRRTTILNIQQEALQWVADRGYDARMGGRALKRQIEQDLTYLSAQQLLHFQHEGPIILNISLRNDQLEPDIHPLEFAQPQPVVFMERIPDDQQGGPFYRKLGRIIDQLREDISDYEAGLPDDFGKDWRYYQFKTQLDVIKQDISTIRIAYSDRYYREALGTPLRLKQTAVSPWREDEKSSSDIGGIKAKLFQEAALKELSDAYRFAPNEFDNLRSEFIDKYLNVALIRLFGDAFLEDRYEICTLHIQSLIADQGQAEIEYLRKLYRALFEHLDLSWQDDNDSGRLTVEGYGISDLMQAEAGIHLFYVAHRNPLPIRVQLRTQQLPEQGMPSGKNHTPEHTYTVVRIYDGNKSMTDLRSRFTNAVNMTPQEFKLLVYAGLPASLQQGWFDE